MLYDVEAPLLTFNELVVTVPVFIPVCVVPVEVDPDVVPPVEEEVVDTYFPPVSYTHLDVYKRQFTYFTNRFIKIFILKTF